MKYSLSVICTALLILTHTPLPALADQGPVSVVGRVADASGRAVTMARVIIRDHTGKPLDAAAVTSEGRYRLNGLTPGQYRLTLASPVASFKEQTVVANLGNQGLTVNWMVAAAVAPIAKAQPGTAATGGLFGLGDAWTVVGINVLGAAVGTGAAAAAGGFSSNTGNKTSTPAGSPSL